MLEGIVLMWLGAYLALWSVVLSSVCLVILLSTFSIQLIVVSVFVTQAFSWSQETALIFAGMDLSLPINAMMGI